jgi:hypothetical protein
MYVYAYTRTSCVFAIQSRLLCSGGHAYHHGTRVLEYTCTIYIYIIYGTRVHVYHWYYDVDTGTAHCANTTYRYIHGLYSMVHADFRPPLL